MPCRPLRLLLLVVFLLPGCGDTDPPITVDAGADRTVTLDGVGPRAEAAGADAARVDGAPLKPDAFAGRPNVWIVGDSLAVGAGNAAKTLLGAKYDLTVRAKVGASIMQMFPEVQNAVAAKADAIVIQLGINNVGGGTANVTQLTADIGKTLDATKGTRCVYWVTYKQKYTTGYTALNQSAPTLNQIIRAEVQKRSSWVGLIDWQPYIDAHPELVAVDDLHRTMTGYQKLAGYYGDALKGCFGF